MQRVTLSASVRMMMYRTAGISDMLLMRSMIISGLAYGNWVAKRQEAPVLKYINMEKESLTAHVLWYDPYDSTPWAKAKDGSVVIYHNQTGRIRAWAWRNGEIVQNGERYSSKAVTVTKDGVNTMLLPWRPAAPDVVPEDDDGASSLALYSYRS